MTISPWHMWGSSVATTIFPNLVQSAQLSRVEYKRPESWRFEFYARILRSSITVAPATVLVTFQVASGVGRANVQIPTFEQYSFQILLSGEQGASQPKFTTSVLAPTRDDSASTPVRSVVDTIVGQDVQIGYSALLLPVTLPATDQVQLEIGALLAPWHHARPDWMLHHFLGEETEGR